MHLSTQARMWCRLERGLISWKELTLPQLLHLRRQAPNHPALPNHAANRAFETYWERIRRRECYDQKGWKPVYTNRLPPKHTLLREERIPHVGQYAAVDENNNILERVDAERFVLMQMPYLPLDCKGRFDVLIIDIDCNFNFSALKAAAIPLPRYCVSRRPETGDPPLLLRRPHLVYWLRRPVKRGKNGQRTAEERYYHAVRETLIKKLRDLDLEVDDKLIDLSKNPHSDNWDYVQGEYRDWSLGELKKALEPLVSAKRPYPRDPAQTDTVSPDPQSVKRATIADQSKSLLEECAGRNDYIFNRTRRAAYAQKRLCSEDFDMGTWIENFAHELNHQQFTNYNKGPLSQSEVDGIVRSVAGFVINLYEPGGEDKDRGACVRAKLIHAGMSKKTKQGVGGKYGAQKHADKTRQRVLDALETFDDQERQPSVSAVAKRAEVSRPTARKWMTILAAEQSQIATQKVENTVAIRKGDVIPASARQQIGRSRRLGVGDVGQEQGVTHALADTAGKSAPAIDADIPYHPLKVRPASGNVILYRHPFDRELVLTQQGDIIRAQIPQSGHPSITRAPLTVLDLGGFLDDDDDEYAPPIGEMDANGVIRFEENTYAPGRKQLTTTEWTDAEVDAYFARTAA